jgi:hypothetical protein
MVKRNYNAVDRNERDSANYSTTIRMNRYYLRIFCWALDRVIHAAYVVVCFLIKSDIGQKSGNGIWMAILAVMTFRLILHCP